MAKTTKSPKSAPTSKKSKATTQARTTTLGSQKHAMWDATFYYGNGTTEQSPPLDATLEIQVRGKVEPMLSTSEATSVIDDRLNDAFHYFDVIPVGNSAWKIVIPADTLNNEDNGQLYLSVVRIAPKTSQCGIAFSTELS